MPGNRHLAAAAKLHQRGKKFAIKISGRALASRHTAATLETNSNHSQDVHTSKHHSMNPKIRSAKQNSQVACRSKFPVTLSDTEKSPFSQK